MTENLTEPLTEQAKINLSELIEKELGTSNYELNITKASAAGDNYIGIVHRISAIVNETSDKVQQENNNSDNDKKKSLHLILKVPPQNKARREQFFARPCFLREIWFYDEIFPMFTEFQLSKGIDPSLDNGFHEIPKCYHVITDEMEESLFFDDLKMKGFEMYDRLKIITFPHVKLVMETLGKLHAISFALRDQDNEKFKMFTDIKDVFTSTNRANDEQFVKYLDYLLSQANDSIAAPGDEYLRQKIDNQFKEENIWEQIKNNISGEAAEPYTVLCHGDCWNNNILYRYDAHSGEPVDLRFLDFQITRYASPACDLTYFLFCCTTQAFRDEHYDTVIKIYHKSLCDLLYRLGSNPEKLFPFEALQQQLKKFGKFGLLMAFMLIPVLIKDGKDAPDLNKMAEQLENNEGVDLAMSIQEKEKHKFMDRIRGIIYDQVRLGYL